jgi:hypothetical protein
MEVRMPRSDGCTGAAETVGGKGKKPEAARPDRQEDAGELLVGSIRIAHYKT